MGRKLDRDHNPHIKSAISWLKCAQDATQDGGVSAWYSLLSGWAPSYIETTGYIISTFLDGAKYLGDKDFYQRSIRMADFLLENQLKDGGFRRAVVGKGRLVPRVFNTSQDIIGLVDIYQNTNKAKYLKSTQKAADWLCTIQEPDGRWVKNTFGKDDHTYHTRVAWALIKVFKVTKLSKYEKAARKNLDWAARNQRSNGWFNKNGLPPFGHQTPFTHTIAYAIEGFLWSGLVLKDKKYLDVARRAAEALLDYWQRDKNMPGTFDRDWQSRDRYSCLTGNAQIAVIWLKLYQLTRRDEYLRAASELITYLKTIQKIKSTNKNIKGAIGGSDPIYGDLLGMKGYSRLAYVSWAAKFFVDALILEDLLTDQATKKPHEYIIYQA